MTHPHDPAPVEAVLSAPTLHLLLLTGLAFFALVAVASCVVPVYAAVRRRVAR